MLDELLKQEEQGYFMYGICLPYKWALDWETANNTMLPKKFHNVMCDDVFTSDTNPHYRIHTLFNGVNGKHIIMGREIEKSPDHLDHNGIMRRIIQVPELNSFEIDYLKGLIKKHFGVEGDYHYYYIK